MRSKSRLTKLTMTQIADRMALRYCEQCEAYELLLYMDGDELPFAACSFTPEQLAHMLDADTEDRIGAYIQ